MPSQQSTTEPHVSLVHDFFLAWGGAEVVFDALTQAFPNNTIYAAFDQPETRHAPLDKAKVNTTFLNKLPFRRTFLREIYKFLLPLAFSRLTFSPETSIIISDTASFTKFIIPPPGIKHLVYIHTPPRFLWNMPTSKKVRRNNFLRFMWNIVVGTAFRVADFLHARRAHALIANSQEVVGRIRKFYRREPITVINPPVYVRKFVQAIESKKIAVKPEFLAFNRIEPYKNFDKLIRAWPAGYKLTIAGTGSQEKEIARLAAKNPDITFINRYIPDAEKPTLFASYAGYLYPNIEDFGIIMVEALSVGTPVVSFKRGGGSEIVSHGQTGYLIDELTTEQLKPALDWCLAQKRGAAQQKRYLRDMLKYDIESFIREIRKLASEYTKET